MNSIWKDHDTPKGGRNNDGGWFTRISAAIDKNAKIRNIERGMSIKDKATPLGRVGVQEIVKFLLRKNSKEGVLKAMYVLVTFLTVGRAGEAEWASWKQAEFNSVYSNLTIQWNEHKTHQQSFMDFFADRDNFNTDIYFLFALFWIAGSHLVVKTTNLLILTSGSGANSRSDPKYKDVLKSRNVTGVNDGIMFPALVVGNAAAVVTSAIKECIGKVPFVEDSGNYTARSLRSGGLQEIVSRGGDKFSGIFRGGWWNFEYEHTFSEYISGCFELSTKAGLLLSGYQKGVTKAPTPNLSLILNRLSEADQRMLLSFIGELFRSSFADIEENGLLNVMHVVFASYIRYLSEFQEAFPYHFIVQQTVEVARKYNISFDTLLNWGKIIGKK